MSSRSDHYFRHILIWLGHGQFFMILVYFMSVLLTKIFLLYPFVFPMLKFKSLGSMYVPVPTEKSTFDNAYSNIR